MSDFPEKAEDKVNTLAIIVIGLATTALLWASVVALQAYFETTHGEVVAERKAMGLTRGIRDLDAAQIEQLQRSAYADSKLGTLEHINIEYAKKAVLESARKGEALIPSLQNSEGELNTPSILVIPGVGQAIPAEPAAPEGEVPAEGEPAEGVPAEGEAAPAEGAAAEGAPAPAPAEAAAAPAQPETEAAQPVE